MNYFSFKRPTLAVAYCDSLEGKGIANARSGLFLAGPRRVGKSTFLTDELIPEAHKRDWTTVYVDLWSNKNADPSLLIADAINSKIASYEGLFSKLTKSVKLDIVSLKGAVQFDFSKRGLPDKLTLTEALRILGKLAGKPILLIIDEAQHALTTENGLNTMFAIKSARDQLNVNLQKPSLMLTCTGSNRDKLAHLVLKKDQPFFGSDIASFPLLDINYTDAFTDWANQSLAASNQFSKKSMWQAFILVGHRPEILRTIAGRIALSGDANEFTKLLEQDAVLWHNRIWEEFENDYAALSALQQAILQVLIEKNHAWVPFSEESINRYKMILQQGDVTTTSVQTALQYLRDHGFIWQSGRGIYTLEDESFAEWFKHSHKGTVNHAPQK